MRKRECIFCGTKRGPFNMIIMAAPMCLDQQKCARRFAVMAEATRVQRAKDLAERKANAR